MGEGSLVSPVLKVQVRMVRTNSEATTGSQFVTFNQSSEGESPKHGEESESAGAAASQIRKKGTPS